MINAPGMMEECPWDEYPWDQCPWYGSMGANHGGGLGGIVPPGNFTGGLAMDL